MSYISHSDAPLDGPFNNLKKQICDHIDFKSFAKHMNFKIWNEVVNGMCTILSKIFPPCLNKEILKQYEKQIDKHAKDKLRKEKEIFDRNRTKEDV